jgi:hypothetical protein
VKSFTSFALGCLITLFLRASVVAQEGEGHEHSYAIPEEGTGLAHMDISCSPAVVAKFDQALALLHNFWYSRALEGFQQILSADPQCAMAYWGAAMTYNHPFWDAPSASDETAAWHFVQRALAPKEMSSRERLYVRAVAALFKDEEPDQKALETKPTAMLWRSRTPAFPTTRQSSFMVLLSLAQSQRAPRVLSARIRRRSFLKKFMQAIRAILACCTT